MMRYVLWLTSGRRWLIGAWTLLSAALVGLWLADPSWAQEGAAAGSAFGSSTSTPCDSSGAVIIKITSNTNITSI